MLFGSSISGYSISAAWEAPHGTIHRRTGNVDRYIGFRYHVLVFGSSQLRHLLDGLYLTGLRGQAQREHASHWAVWFPFFLENRVNQVFTIIADGKRVGCTVAPNAEVALTQALRSLTRSTSSKEDSDPDYQSVHVSPFSERGVPTRSGFVSRLLNSIAEVSNSRFIETV